VKPINLVKHMARIERDLIRTALDATEGNKARAAALLGLKRTTLVMKLKADEEGNAT